MGKLGKGFMGLFKSNYEKKLDEIINQLEVNMSNNYKDNARDNLRELTETFGQIKAEGLLKEKRLKYYEDLLADYQTRMVGYSHKDQKPYWT